MRRRRRAAICPLGTAAGVFRFEGPPVRGPTQPRTVFRSEHREKNAQMQLWPVPAIGQSLNSSRLMGWSGSARNFGLTRGSFLRTSLSFLCLAFGPERFVNFAFAAF